MPNKLLHGDNRLIIPELAGTHVDVVFADPPYGISKAAWDDYFPRDWFYECRRNWPDALYLIKSGAGDPLKEAINLVGDMYVATFSAWLSNGMSRGAVSFGNWTAIVIAKRDRMPWQQAQDVIRADAGLEVEKITINSKDKVNHPSPAPPGLMRAIVARFSQPGQTWLDPFMGSGTTGVACTEAGLDFIGLERDAAYFKLASERIAQAEAAELERLFTHA